MVDDSNRQSGSGGSRVEALLTELQDLIDHGANPQRQDEICQRVLQIDHLEHVLDEQTCGAVLATRGNALQDIAHTVGGEVYVSCLRQASVCYDAALSRISRAAAPLNWAKAFNGKGNVLQTLAEGQNGNERNKSLCDAIACYDRALEEISRTSSPGDWAAIMTNKGTALQTLAEDQSGVERNQSLHNAITCFDDALQVYRQESAPLDWARTLTSRGSALQTLAERQSGIEWFQTLHQAISCYNDALLVYSREVAPHAWARTLTNKGIALQTLAEDQSGAKRAQSIQDALNGYDDALLVYRRETAPLSWAATYTNKGTALKILAEGQKGDERATSLYEAITCYNNALLEYRQNVALLNWARAITNKGVVLKMLAEGQQGVERIQTLHEAERAYLDVLTIFPKEVHPASYRIVAYGLTRTYVLQAAHASDAERERVALEHAWEVASSAIAAADLLALQAPSLAFRQQEWVEGARVYTIAACVRALQGHLEKAVALIERGRARGLAEAAGRRNADLTLLTEEDRDTYLRAVEAVQAIEAHGRQGGDPLVLVEEARKTNERLAAEVARLRKTYPDFLPERNASLSALTTALHSDEALVYLIPQEAGTLLLAVPHTGEPQQKWLASLTSNDIFDLAVQKDSDGSNSRGFLPAALGWLRRDRDALARALDELLPQLGDRLMRHVVALAREAGCQRIVLVPSGYLSVLPLHAATYAPMAGERETAPDGRRYACDDLAITYAPSGLTLLDARRTAMRQRRAGKARRLFIAGNPQLTPEGQPWTPVTPHYLRYAEWEASQVGEIAAQRVAPLDIDLALNEQATWKRVVEGLGNADASHLALHAAFNFDDPQQSAFLVAFQAKLLLRDLLDPRLTNLARLRLVVLSACQSALSDVSHQSEEAVGLFGALLAGGVPEVIGTLWSVNDLATAALMESFAQRYFTQGRTADDALREATRDLRGIRDAPDATHPATSPAALPATSMSALRRWSELAERDPEAVDATRLLDDKGLAEAGEVVRRFAAGQSKRAIPRDHPVYWAAFVFHGASLPLDSDIPAEPAESADDLIAAPVQPFAPPQSALASDEPRDAENRTADYFPAVEGVCPRCYAQDFVSTHDDLGRELRQCLSCQQVYRLSAPRPDPPQ